MNHLDFILWMLFFPISVSICNYIESRYKKDNYSKETKALTGLTIVAIWLFVGYKLF